MKLIQLSYFVGVVEYGGYIAAARRLNVAQPALSRQISSLERELGAKLLNRGPGGTVATEAGRRFYRHARSILDQVDTAREEARAGERTIAGAVRLGIPVGMAGALAAKVAPRWYWTLELPQDDSWRLDGSVARADISNVTGD